MPTHLTLQTSEVQSQTTLAPTRPDENRGGLGEHYGLDLFCEVQNDEATNSVRADAGSIKLCVQK